MTSLLHHQNNTRISDRKFLESYCDWGSRVNWFACEVLLAALERTSDLEAKKALFVKIFYEYIQACEHLLVFVHAVKQSASIRGIKRRIVECPSRSSCFKYLWKDVRRFRTNPFKLYGYLGLRLSRTEYLDDQRVFDGFYKALLACLRHRYAKGRGERGSWVIRAFNKIKHGFPVFTAKDDDKIHVLVKSGRRITSLPFRLNYDSARKMCKSAEAMRNSLINITAFLLTLPRSASRQTSKP